MGTFKKVTSSNFTKEIKRNTPTEPWTYEALDARQRVLQQEILKSPKSVFLLLSEVAPVITFSRKGEERLKDNFFLEKSQIANAGISFLETDRGGNATYHGPGQWVVFVLGTLERLTGDSKGVRKMIQKLLNASVKVAREYVPTAEIRDGAEWGIWSQPGARGQKLVSCGIKISQGVVLHGLCFNGYQTEQSFMGLKPCGLDAQAGYLFKNQNDFNDLAKSVIVALEQEFA